MQKIILAYAINMFLKAVANFGDKVDWVSLKAKVVADIQVHVPAIVDPIMEKIASTALDDLAALLQDATDLKAILLDIANSDWSAAMAALTALAEKLFVPATPEQASLLASLKVA